MATVSPPGGGARRRPQTDAPAASGEARRRAVTARDAGGTPAHPGGAHPGTARTGSASRQGRPDVPHRAAAAPTRARRPPAPPPDPVLAEIEALAFATDPRSENALREGLVGCRDVQVWPGGLRATVEALDQGQPSPRLLFVDLDETPYPAGAIYELSSVCEVGTVVVALGSDDTARFSREVLLAGVTDYLVKPITATAVREAAARAARSATDSTEGHLVGFAGAGGSGTTTLAAASALRAAERGRYVSILDLNRSFSALSFMLDVEPAGGLVDLLSTTARASLHPEMVDGMRTERSDRIAVYGYPWSPSPPPLAPVWAVCELLVELQRRSHLVIVDGMDDPATRQTLLAMLDVRVVVMEPTATGAVAAARMLARLGPMRGPDWPLVLVHNHTRTFKAETGARTLGRSGVDITPDVVVPFEPTVPALADRGWPDGRLPRPLHAPLDRLVDRVLSSSGREASVTAARDPAGASRRAASGRRSASPRRGSWVGSALRRLLPRRATRPRPA